jgi:poly-gamma-glutamate capsule biosynthesis protein CapA/YwtB (metallophosphatase superfamily)
LFPFIGEKLGLRCSGVASDLRRGLIDEARVDIVHGHSSHHPIAIEVHGTRPIFYGCGDFINDYEGIGGHEALRPYLTLAYFVDLNDRSHNLLGIEMTPFHLRKFRLVRASKQDARWLSATIDRECRTFGRGVRLGLENTMTLEI